MEPETVRPTATRAVETLLSTLQDFFELTAPTRRGDAVLVAFSGGPDSTALLWGLARLRPELEIELTAAHLDHGLDPDSGRRAREAHRLAAAIGVPLVVERLEDEGARHNPGRERKGLEAWARARRYAFLERHARRLGARYLATAHHAGDQAETVLLRLLFGSGLEGLAGIAARRGKTVRPLLGLERRVLSAAVAAAGLVPVGDPTNRDLGIARNLVRHHLLPRLGREVEDLPARLVSLARAAGGARKELELVLERRLQPRALAAGGAAFDLSALAALPEPLWPHALALLHRRAGARYPPHLEARRELRRQLASRPIGCDCGDGWRWEEEGGALLLLPPETPTPAFAYTMVVPGEVALPEIGKRLSLAPGTVEPWMFRGSSRRAALAAPLAAGDRVEIRNRRPGDRMHPLGGRSKSLKRLLIDRRVPRRERDRIPLLWVGGRLAWVPGVALGESFRIRRRERVWIAELRDLEAGG